MYKRTSLDISTACQSTGNDEIVNVCAIETKEKLAKFEQF